MHTWKDESTIQEQSAHGYMRHLNQYSTLFQYVPAIFPGKSLWMYLPLIKRDFWRFGKHSTVHVRISSFTPPWWYKKWGKNIEERGKISGIIDISNIFVMIYSHCSFLNLDLNPPLKVKRWIKSKRCQVCTTVRQHQRLLHHLVYFPYF